MSDSEFTVNGKPVSPWVGRLITVGVLLLIIGLITLLLTAVTAVIVYFGLLLGLVILAVVTLLPFDLALRVCGRKGLYRIKRTMKYYDDDDFWADDEDDNSARHSVKVSFGNDEWERSYLFETRPLQEAVARR